MEFQDINVLTQWTKHTCPLEQYGQFYACLVVGVKWIIVFAFFVVVVLFFFFLLSLFCNVGRSSGCSIGSPYCWNVLVCMIIGTLKNHFTRRSFEGHKLYRWLPPSNVTIALEWKDYDDDGPKWAQVKCANVLCKVRFIQSMFVWQFKVFGVPSCGEPIVRMWERCTAFPQAILPSNMRANLLLCIEPIGRAQMLHFLLLRGALVEMCRHCQAMTVFTQVSTVKL